MSPIYVPGKVTLRQTWQPMDPDAAAYIAAVETADGQALEEKVKVAIDNFVLGCKADGIWSAIKASCILAGARTLTGALVPLKGTAPTNNYFVSGDYDRETGLVGNGSTKYLDSNRANNADPQNSKHLVVYQGAALAAGSSTSVYAGVVGPSFSQVGASSLLSGTFGAVPNADRFAARLNGQTRLDLSEGSAIPAGLKGASRQDGSTVSLRAVGVTTSIAGASEVPISENIFIFARNVPQSFPVDNFSSARLAFYSIGESLDLAKLDARVTDLINAIGVAIP